MRGRPSRPLYQDLEVARLSVALTIEALEKQLSAGMLDIRDLAERVAITVSRHPAHMHGQLYAFVNQRLAQIQTAAGSGVVVTLTFGRDDASVSAPGQRRMPSREGD